MYSGESNGSNPETAWCVSAIHYNDELVHTSCILLARRSHVAGAEYEVQSV